MKQRSFSDTLYIEENVTDIDAISELLVKWDLVFPQQEDFSNFKWSMIFLGPLTFLVSGDVDRDNFLELHIYYGELKHELREQEIDYTVWQVYSKCVHSSTTDAAFWV